MWKNHFCEPKHLTACFITKQNLVFQLLASLRRPFCSIDSGSWLKKGNLYFDSNSRMLKQKQTPSFQANAHIEDSLVLHENPSTFWRGLSLWYMPVWNLIVSHLMKTISSHTIRWRLLLKTSCSLSLQISWNIRTHPLLAQTHTDVVPPSSFSCHFLHKRHLDLGEKWVFGISSLRPSVFYLIS